NPKAHIIIRTRYIQEMKPLYELGANEVIPEEFETSVEIFTRVLAKYLIPKDEIEKLVAEVRSDSYEMFRSLSKETASFSDLNLQLPDVEISTLRIAERSPLVGKSLAEIELRKKYGVTVLAVRRESQILSNPDVDILFYANDVLFVLGTPEKVAGVASLSQNPGKGNAN
ncbi:MAG: potassium transporter KefB, partial [Deltaproteobacteria bacterium]|nr:potassium transporter KefB [Deltaproteobacteria bacterium]